MKVVTSLVLILSLILACGDKEKTAHSSDAQIVPKLELRGPTYSLRHLVFLNINPDLSVEDVLTLHDEINKLKAIPQVHEYRLGSFTDLKDKRAFSEYEIMFEMAFANEADYQIYQQSEIHLNLKAQLGPYLEGPPATYDLTDL